ncbi:MAG: hypothetical protein KIT31_13760 [Deltaproteobacteria bacterium]|nr:hypothetical protein [Deltaproteobacteria bacterium]
MTNGWMVTLPAVRRDGVRAARQLLGAAGWTCERDAGVVLDAGLPA